jgi:hypothetical protein
MPFGLERAADLGDLGQAFCSPQDRADDLAGVATGDAGGVNRSIPLGLPSLRQVRDLDSLVVGPDPQAVVFDGALGGNRLDLNSEGHVAGVHRVLLCGGLCPSASMNTFSGIHARTSS